MKTLLPVERWLLRWVYAAGVFFAYGLGISEEFAPESRFDRGVVWITLEIVPEKVLNGAHGGWDFFDGEEKQFWIGSGWGAHAGKWGVWSAESKQGAFQHRVEVGEPVSLHARIDFGDSKGGDESVTVWMGDSAQGKPIASLEEIAITGFDRLITFVHRQGTYKFGEPVLSDEKGDRDGLSLLTQQIRPLFKEKCGGCHGDRGEKIKGEFDMRTREGLLAGGESGMPALVPGKPDESPLFVSLTWKDPDLEMPPKENDRLNADHIE